MGKVLRGKTPAVRNGTIAGKDKGHITTPRAYRAKASSRKGKLGMFIFYSMYFVLVF